MESADAPIREPSSRRLFPALALACLALAAGLRFWAIDFGLPHAGTRPDEAPVLELTALAAQGVYEFDWANYPHAYVYLHWLWGELVLPVYALAGKASGADYAEAWRLEAPILYGIGRRLTAIFGVASVGLVIVAARRSLGGPAALVAGLWLAVNLLHVRDSHALKPDVLLGLAVLLCLMASVRLAQQPSLGRGALAGLTVGLAAAAKYNGVLAALAVIAAAWQGARSKPLHRRLLPPPLIVAGLCAAGFFLATSPYLLTNDASQQMLHRNLHAVFPTWFEPPAEGITVDLDELDLPAQPAWVHRYGRFSGFIYHLTFSMRYGAGIVATLLLPFALVWGLRSPVLLARLSAIFVLGWYAVVSLSPVLLSRYLTPALAPIALLEAGFAVALARRFAPEWVNTLAGATALVLCLQPLWNSVQLDRLLARPDSRVQAGSWLAANARPGDRALLVGTRFWNWGEPELPAGVRRQELRGHPRIDAGLADWVIAHDHELFWSDADRGLLKRSARSLELRAEFVPIDPHAPPPVFERNDAWYAPIAGFAAVRFPGPHVQIYRVRQR